MSLEQFDLSGKVAMVTGAGTGIGQAIAYALAEAGADLVGVYRTHIDETREHLSEMGRLCHTIQIDFLSSTVEDLSEVVESTVETAGRLDILVNNAGTIRKVPALCCSAADWDDVLTVNLRSPFFLCQAAACHFMDRGRGGKIINIASLLSFQGGDDVVSYTASKSGLAGITKALSSEWARYGINVNAIAPGYIITENTRPLWDSPDENRRILKRLPAERWGRPSDLEGAAVFLASAASDYVHGAVLPVDGGWLAR